MEGAIGLRVLCTPTKGKALGAVLCGLTEPWFGGRLAVNQMQMDSDPSSIRKMWAKGGYECPS
jgi:hypothetical protein